MFNQYIRIKYFCILKIIATIKQTYTRLNWNCAKFRQQYQDKLEQNWVTISNLFSEIKLASDKEKIKILLTTAVNNLTSIAIRSTSEAKNNSDLKPHPKPESWYEKQKSWWCDTLTKLHNTLTSKYKQYHHSNFNPEFN